MKIFIVAGEPSGDLLGAGLLRALRRRDANVAFYGVGGENMAAQGLKSLFPMSAISFMGVLPVLAHLRSLLARIDQTAQAAIDEKPDVLVLIDAPDFNHRVAKKVRKVRPDQKIVIYVGPTVWAWRPGRAKKIKAFVDLILAIFPFEPEVHKRLGGPDCVYVGHPLIEKKPLLQGEDAAKLSGPVLILPGSRASVLDRLGPVFGGAVARLAVLRPGLDMVIPTAQGLSDKVAAMISDWPVKPRIVTGEDEKYRLFRAARAALAASGTVTLELALSRTPTIVAYKVPKIEEFFARRLIQISMVAQPNIILGEMAFPEMLQDQAEPGLLAQKLVEILDDGLERRRQLAALEKLEEKMAIPAGLSPSDRAAETVLRLAGGA